MSKTEKFFTKTMVVCLGAMICCALWGSAYPCIKLGYRWLHIGVVDTPTQVLFAGVRFTLAGILTVIIGSFLQRKFLYPRLRAVPKVVWLSVLQTILQYIFFYIGLAHTSGVKSAIIGGVNVFVALLVAALIFHQEKITSRKLVGCIIGFAGVVLVNISNGGLDMNMSFMGEGFIFLSTVSYAFSSVHLKMFSKKENPIMLSGYQFIIGGLVMIWLGRDFGGHLDFDAARAGGTAGAAIAMIIYLAFVSAIAYSLWGILLKYNPVSKVTVFGFMTPVFGAILSVICLGEISALGISAVMALILVGVGIYIVNSSGER